MNRRERITASMGSGGTAVPSERRKQLRAALSNARKQPTGPGGQTEIPQRTPPPMRFPQVGNPAPRQGSPLRPPLPLGKQLSGRVQSGAIGGKQAQNVARQRQLLKNAFGSDWRTKVFGAGGAKGISGPFAQRQVAAKRAQGLSQAKRKLY